MADRSEDKEIRGLPSVALAKEGQKSEGGGRNAEIPDHGSEVPAPASGKREAQRPVVKEQKLDIEVGHTGDELKILVQRWREVTEKVAKIAVTARTVLPDLRPARVEKDRVVLAVDPEFADDPKRFHDLRMRKALEHVLSAILNREVTVEISVAANETPPPEDDVDLRRRPRQRARRGRREKSRQDLINDPAVQKVIDTFGGGIVDVRE